MTIDYHFTDGNCYAMANGTCPMEKFKDIEVDESQHPKRNDFYFCPIMARKMLNGTLNPTLPVQVYLNKKCGHAEFNDGRHRTCVTQHLHDLGIDYDLLVKLYEPNKYCLWCKMDRQKNKKCSSKKLPKYVRELGEIQRATETEIESPQEFTATIEMGTVNKSE